MCVHVLEDADTFYIRDFQKHSVSISKSSFCHARQNDKTEQLCCAMVSLRIIQSVDNLPKHRAQGLFIKHILCILIRCCCSDTLVWFLSFSFCFINQLKWVKIIMLIIMVVTETKKFSPPLAASYLVTKLSFSWMFALCRMFWFVWR